MMKHIVHILASSGTGGMESHVQTLCNALATRFRVTLIVPVVAPGLSSAVQVIALKSLAGSRWNPLLHIRLWRLLKALSPDIVHVHGSKAAQLVASNRYAWVKRIATVHGIKKRSSFLRGFNHVIAVSEAVKLQLQSQGVASAISVILNGIVPFSAPSAPQRNRGTVRPYSVLAIGRLAPVKGFDLLIRAWPLVQEARLRIAGDGPERSHLLSLIEANGLRDRIELLGHRDDIRDLLASSDLMVISSLREGMPLVLAEALHAHCPVVSTAVGGMVGFLPEFALTPSGDPAAFAQKINEALSDLQTFSHAFDGLYDFAERNMTVDAMAQQTLMIYQGTLD
jgi:glycosyltransferase involved in cell wall biosynthesis